MWIWISKKAFESLSERVTALERTSKQLDLEWSNTYDKFRSILGRIAKRHDRLKEAEGDGAGSQEDASGLPSPSGLGEASSSLPLTPRQISAQQRILAQRALTRRHQ